MRLLSRLLLAVGVLLLVAAVPAVWLDRWVLDTGRFTQALAPLVDDPGFRARLSDRMADEVEGSVSLPAPVGRAVRRGLEQVVATDGFADAWTTAVRRSHGELVAALTDSGRTLTADETTLSVDLGYLVDEARARLVERGVPLAERIPDVRATYPLVESPRLGRLGAAVRFVDRWAAWLAVAAVVALAAGVATARSRARALAAAGLASAAGMALLAAVTWGVRRWGLDDLPAGVSPETSRAAYDALTSPLLTLLAVVGVSALVAAAAGWVLSRGSRPG